MAPDSYEIIHDLWWRLDQLVKTTNAAVLRETKEKQAAGRKACVSQWTQALMSADNAKRAATEVHDLAKATRSASLPKIKEWQKTIAACTKLITAVVKLLSHEPFDQDDRDDLSASLSTFQRYLIPDLQSFQKEIERMK